jgi:hypothetical protein
MLLSAAMLAGDKLFPQDTANYDPSCVVKDIKIALHVSTATGFSGLYTQPFLQMGASGKGVGFSGGTLSVLYSFKVPPASGNQIGTTCDDFALDTAATTVFDPAAIPPPYSGVYQLDAARTGVGREWRLKDIQYDLANASRHPPDTVLQCARIDVTTKIVP